MLLLAPRVIDNFDRLAYVGMSRAKAVLEVVRDRCSRSAGLGLVVRCVGGQLRSSSSSRPHQS